MITTIGGATAYIGTFTHMAPETVLGGYIDPFQADVYGSIQLNHIINENIVINLIYYSFGIFMFELALGRELTGRNPDPDMNTPQCLSFELREKWWQIALQCSNKDPKLRPTMPEVLSRLCDFSSRLPSTHYSLFVNLNFNIGSDYICRKHGTKDHHVYISCGPENIVIFIII